MTRFLVGLVFLAVALVAVAGFAITRHSAEREEERLLHERASEVTAILSTSASLASSLQLVGEVYAAGDQGDQAFAASAGLLIAAAVPVVGVAEVVDDHVDDHVVVRAVHGDRQSHR